MKTSVRLLIAALLFCGWSGKAWPADLPMVGSIAIEGAEGVYVSGASAYVCNSDGVKMVNISNPSNPIVSNEYDEATITDIYVSGNTAYSLVWYNQNFCISDISNIHNPENMGCVSFSAQPRSIYVSGHYAYITTYDGLYVFNVSDVYNPVQVGSMQCNSPQELSCFSPNEVYVSGNRAYLADLDGILIVDISNPANPVGVARVTKNGTNTQAGSENLWANGVFVAGSLAYVADSNGDCLRVLDITNPDAPVLLGSVVLPSLWGDPHHVYVSGSHAYVTNHESLFIVDISGASAPPLPQTTPPSVQISLNKAQFQPGDAMAVTLATTPGSEGGAWDIYVGLQTPDGTLYFFTYDPAVSLGTVIAPARPLGPILAQTSPILNLTMPAGLPTGGWTWAALLAKPDLSEISPASWAPFTFQAAFETGSATGEWNGNWESIIYSGYASGTFYANIVEQGATLTGTIDVPFVGLDDATLVGSITGTHITFGDISGWITFTGEIDGNGASGTYTFHSLGDSGTWQALKSP